MNEMERLSIEEIIEHCNRHLNRFPSGTRNYQEHESTRAYLQMLRHYQKIGTVEEFAAYKQAESEGRIAPCSVGDTVYIVTKCEKIPTILDGTLYGSNGGPGTATGYYCPYEDNCPHDAQDCEPVKEQFAIFEDVIERVIFDEDGISVYSEYCCCNTLGEDAFLEKDKASATLAAKEGEHE